jgi:hypothetical protein
MTRETEKYLARVLARNCRAFANDADDYGLDADEQGELCAIAERLENGTATQQDWYEAVAQLDIAG